MDEESTRVSSEAPSRRRMSTGGPPVPSLDVERESSTSFPDKFRRAFSRVRPSIGDESALSPRQDTAGRMLSPILSRAREQQQEYESELASMSGHSLPSPAANGHSDSTTEPNSDKIPVEHPMSFSARSFAGRSFSAKSTGPKSDKKMNPFKAAAQSLNAIAHPPALMPVFRGGEGIRRLVETREKNNKIFGLSVEYWDISLFSIRGRAWPMLPQLLYIMYSTVITVISCRFIPNITEVPELAGLQYLISTMGLALFLLLSFRTNSSYERWWEGRKLWDGISSKVDDLTRLALAWVAAKDRPCASGMIRWTLAYAIVAKKALRTDQTYPELAGILSDKEREELESDIDPVTMVSDRISAYVYQCSLEPALVSPAIFSAMDADIKGLNCDMTACMRILGTPMPFAYIVHLRSFMVLWLLGLPFAFILQLQYWSIIVCTVVGYELLGFETICVEVENPFGTDFNDLPLDTITSELFVKCASALAKLGLMVDIEPIVKADPLFGECRHAPVQYSRRGSEALPEIVIPVRDRGVHFGHAHGGDD